MERLSGAPGYFEELRQQFVTGRGPHISRRAIPPPTGVPMWTERGGSPHPRISYQALPAPEETVDLFGPTASGLGLANKRLTALAPKKRVIDVADWFALPPHTEIEMGSYFRLQRLKCAAEEALFGYVPGWSPPKHMRHPPSPFGTAEERFRPFTQVDPFAQSHGFVQFVSPY